FAGLGYVTRKAGEFGGPIAKNQGPEGMDKLYAELGLGADDGLFFAAGKEKDAVKLAGAARTRVGEEVGLIEPDCFEFCWIVAFQLNQRAQDLMMGAPSPVSARALRDVHIRLAEPPKA